MKCKNCNREMTFFDMRVQYGRLKKRGISDSAIKEIEPRCQKCVTKWFKNPVATVAAK